MRQSMQETIVSLLTAAGRGALAVIAVQGLSAIDAAERFFVPRGHASLRDRVDGAALPTVVGAGRGGAIVDCAKICRKPRNSLPWRSGRM